MATADEAKLRMLPGIFEYAMKLEAVMKAHYQEHQAKGCTCEICRRAEIAWSSNAHTGKREEIDLQNPSPLWDDEKLWKNP